MPTVGQTFTVPTGANFITNFSFYLANDSNFDGGANLRFQPFLMAWSTDHPTGSNLLPASLVYNGNPTPSYLQYLFPAGVSVTPGNVYVAFLTTSGVTQGGSGNGFNQFAGTTSSYAGGQLVYAYTSPDRHDFTSASVWSDGAGQDLGFTAQFTGNVSSVPEPSELALLGTGLGTLIAGVRIRRRKSTAA